MFGRKVLATVAVGLVCLAACAPRAFLPDTTEVTEIIVTRSVSRTLHADVDFTEAGRSRIRQAGVRWANFTQGRVNLQIVFDLDFDDMIGLAEHMAEAHDAIIPVHSSMDIVSRLTTETGLDNGKLLLGATTHHENDAMVVRLVMDRIDPDDFETVVTHELGHVAGLPDLPTQDSVMSAASPAGARVKEFSADDAKLCRAFRYCL